MVVAAALGLAVAVLHPFPDLLPTRILAWVAVLAVAVGLGWARRRDGWLRLALAVLAVVAVFGTCAMKVNAFYGYRPTLGTALGVPAANQVDLAQLPSRPPLWTAGPRQALARSWHAPPGMPRAGRISTVTIPGGRSRFPARPAWLYLPPAYLGSVRAKLPVLVLIPGQPGGPQDWLLAGRLAAVMDGFAAAHDGLAPVVVVPDATGSSLGNTLCLDSRLGAAETYVADDVPAWAAAHLEVDAAHLAIGGFSFGGTCALQLAAAQTGGLPHVPGHLRPGPPHAGRPRRHGRGRVRRRRGRLPSGRPARRAAGPHLPGHGGRVRRRPRRRHLPAAGRAGGGGGAGRGRGRHPAGGAGRALVEHRQPRPRQRAAVAGRAHGDPRPAATPDDYPSTARASRVSARGVSSGR